MGNRTYRWKQPSLDHLQTPKQNQKEYLSKIGYKVGGGAYFNVFLGTTSERLNPQILLVLHKDQHNVVLLHTGSNDITNQIKDTMTEDIINIFKSCINFGVKINFT